MLENFLQLPVLYAVFALVAALVLVPPLSVIASKIGLTDKPDEPGGRKKHDGHIPLIGGLVVFPVFIVFSILAGDSFATHWPLYMAIIVLLATGAIDDRVGLHSLTKFGLQFVAATLVVLPGGAELHQLGNLFGLGDFGLGVISIPFSIVAVVLLINAINLMDGLDGLASGTSFVILGWFLAACLMGGETVFSPSILVLMAALLGFFAYNMRTPLRAKASIFLGDAGSMCLGLMVGWYAIHLSLPEARTLEPMAVAWVLALPIWDECAQFNRRVREGRHPFSPDRGHFHHHFISARIKSSRAVLMVLGIVFLSGGLGVIGSKFGVPLPTLTLLWITGILLHIAFSRDLDNYTNVIKNFLKNKG